MKNKKQQRFVYLTDLNIHGSYMIHNDVSTMRNQQDYQKSDLCCMVTILVENNFINMKN